MPRIFVYKLTMDSGGAPCPYNRLLTLAICKPSIRLVCQRGDWLFGFLAKTAGRGERLIYIAEVTSRLERGSYYKDRRYQKRPDCIYRWVGRDLVCKRGARFHPHGSGLRRDVGEKPGYKKANVLASKNFRYFGREGDCDYKTQFPRVKELIESLGRGHRVHHGLYRDFMELKKTIWRSYRTKVIGKPTHDDFTRSCHGGSACLEIPR